MASSYFITLTVGSCEKVLVLVSGAEIVDHFTLFLDSVVNDDRCFIKGYFTGEYDMSSSIVCVSILFTRDR